MAEPEMETILGENAGFVNSPAMRVVALLIAICVAVLTWLAVSKAVEGLQAGSPPPAMSAKALSELGISEDARACYERLAKQQQELLDQGVMSAGDMEASREGLKAYCYTRN